MKVDIVEISEVKWREEQDIWSDGYRVITTKSNKGVTVDGLIMNRRVGKRVCYYEQHIDRIISIRIETKPSQTKLTSIVQVHMPTSQGVEDELGKVYEEIEELI